MTAPTSTDLREAARALVDSKTKPLGALGRIEEIAIELAVVQNTLTPSVDPARLVVFAADHGVAAQGVSAYPSEVTAQMMANLASGGAAASVFAATLGVELELVDVGVAADLSAIGGVIAAKVRPGTADFTVAAAMTSDECRAALDVGRLATRRAAAAGCRVLCLGEMGIANTTAAAALTSALTGAEADVTVGRGTGVDDQGLARKRAAVERALVRHLSRATRPLAALERLGGLEIAAIAGAILEARAHRIFVVVDGYISSAAALAAIQMEPESRQSCCFAHRSAEPGHQVILDTVGARPLLDLGLRLGEGTGALLAVPLLRAAAAMLRDMATFAEAGVAGKSG